MSVTPASRAAWIVAIARASSGLPSMDNGIAPSPISPTARVPMFLSRMPITFRV
ncbi:hypothetical protein Snas_1328 [Stackebrandtia nassauensis DSM 44728]|uniref:Uncharacterized protein n=1 Tax=Stackebrandtia nassauensis (strain DSM 44728 / CIP 108903 / NRRL B-16338 / NBRC 102104 / LLR-40K-21) TaxID=446470 RepID=D3PU91_STANL|nr:hypothetical protein Snas_1328 [Stackebrandtia nassauensis DSM 44728]